MSIERPLDQVDRVLTSVLEEAWTIFWKDAIVYIVAGAIALLVTTVSLGLFGGVMAVGFIGLVRRVRAGEKVGVLSVFNGFSSLVPATLATLVIAIGVTIGLFLLIVPGLFLACAWAFAFFAMEAEGLRAGEALQKSYDLFKQNPLLVALFGLVLGLLNSVAGTLLVTALLSAPFSTIAMMLLYERLERTAV